MSNELTERAVNKISLSVLSVYLGSVGGLLFGLFSARNGLLAFTGIGFLLAGYILAVVNVRRG